MPFYIVSYDDKSPILWGPYMDQTEALRKQSSLEGKPEVHELPTTDRNRAGRMIKAEMQGSSGLVRLRYGKT